MAEHELRVANDGVLDRIVSIDLPRGDGDLHHRLAGRNRRRETTRGAAAADPQDKPGELSEGGLPAGQYTVIVVSDTGIGMTGEVKSHLFEPFFTTKDRDKGTGLGLATSYGIIKQSGGYIHVYSELGHGTVFKVYLPVVSGDAEETRPPAESTVIQAGTETVLLVEDEDPVRELAVRLLREAGYGVLEARNGVDALRVVQEQPNRKIDIMVTDVIMPHMGDKELADQLLKLFDDQKVWTAARPLFEGPAKDVMDDLEANLLNCGALLLLYGKAPPAWVRAQLLRYSKLEKLRQEPLRLKSILLGPPSPKAEIAWSGGFEKVDCQDGDIAQRVRGILERFSQ